MLDQRIIELGRTNGNLALGDEQAIHQSIEAKKKRLPPLESRIDAARKVLQDLEAELGDLKYDVGFLESLSSPVRRIPPEILGHIFSFACEGEAVHLDQGAYPQENAQRNSGHYLSPAITLTQVCHHWSLVATTVSKIWAQLRISLTGKPPFEDIKRAQDFAYATRLVLDRSGRQPLDLHICQINNRLRTPPILVNELACPNHASRLRSLDVDRLDIAVMGPFLQLPNLEELVLRTCILHCPIPPGRTPRLLKVKILNLDIIQELVHPVTFVDLHLPWSSLTDLSLIWNNQYEGLFLETEAEFLSTIRKMESLTCLRLSLPPSMFSGGLTSTTCKKSVRLPHLRILELQAEDIEEPILLKYVLPALDTPALEHFDVTFGIDNDDTEFVSNVEEFVTSAPQLKTIRIMAGDLYELGFAEVESCDDASGVEIVEFPQHTRQEYADLLRRVYKRGANPTRIANALGKELKKNVRWLDGKGWKYNEWMEDVIGLTLRKATQVPRSDPLQLERILLTLEDDQNLVEGVIRMLSRVPVAATCTFILQI